MKSQHILIVGGGIAGLTLAAALTQKGHSAEIIERTPAWQPVGAGIMLQANAVAVLSALGMGEPLAQRGFPLQKLAITDINGRVLTDLNMQAVEADFGPSYSIHRATLHKILLEACRDVPIRLGESVHEIRQSAEKVHVQFSSGKTGDYALVVGADGLHSQVRALAFTPAQNKLRYSGYTCWRYLADNMQGRTTAMEMWGRGARVGIVPISEEKLYIFLVKNAPANQSDPIHGRQTAVAAQFADFAQPAQDVLGSLSAEIPLMRHDLTEIATPVWSTGRIALVGDAAHAMTPNMGQGAAQAIEGALALAIALEQTNSIPAALALYRQLHADRVKTIHARSRQLGKMAQWSNGLLCTLRNTVTRFAPTAASNANMKKLLAPGIKLARQFG